MNCSGVNFLSLDRGCKCSWFPFQTNVKVVSLILDEEESEDAHPGENVKIKVTGVEEEVGDWC